MYSCSPEKSADKCSYLALGDSYTIGESVPVHERFPVQLIRKLRESGTKMDAVKIVATTGWTGDELAEGIRNEDLCESYDLVSLLIGVNNQYRGRDTAEYRAQFIDLLEKSIQFGNNHPQNIIVISIPDYGVTPFGRERNPDKIAKEIDLFNQINQEESKKAGVHYVDITAISRRAKTDSLLVASDGLHPSGKMYSLWVDEIFPEARQILKKRNK